MTQIVPFLTKESTNWDDLLDNPTFCSLLPPEFSCADFMGTDLITWDKLNIQHELNRARAGGVDAENINGLVADLPNGYRVTELPLIVMILPNGEFELWDGYNRYAASRQLGIPDFPVFIYRLRHSYFNNIEDAYDMVSLGSNNHAKCKPHTSNDFVLRGVQYCKRHNNSLNKQNIFDWISTISHSFTVKQVSDIVNKIYQQTTIAVNILPFTHPKNAQQKVSEIVDNQTSTNPVIVCAKEDTYIERAYLQIMKNYVNHDINQTEVVTYTKACETAEEVLAQRNHVPVYLAELDALIMQYAVKRITSQSPAYVITGALPQLIGIEDPQTLVELVN